MRISTATNGTRGNPRAALSHGRTAHGFRARSPAPGRRSAGGAKSWGSKGAERPLPASVFNTESAGLRTLRPSASPAGRPRKNVPPGIARNSLDRTVAANLVGFLAASAANGKERRAPHHAFGDGGALCRAAVSAYLYPRSPQIRPASGSGVQARAVKLRGGPWTARSSVLHGDGLPLRRGRTSNSWPNCGLPRLGTFDSQKRSLMNASRFAPFHSSLLMAVLAAPAALRAQEIVAVTGRDQLIEPNFEEVSRVGVLEGETWEMFARVTQVAFDVEGNLFVFDELGSREVRVLVFDSTGDFLHEFGRSGQVPVSSIIRSASRC